MKIPSILDQLSFAIDDDQMICVVTSANIRSRIYVVGQVKENIPGVILGEREPYLREKTVGEFKKELTTFSERFMDNNFLIEFTREIDKQTYELLFFELTRIECKNGEVFLCSEFDELKELREIHNEPECE